MPTDPVTVAPDTTLAATTDPATPTAPPSTTAIATAPTTPPLSELDALKAEIAADYVESEIRINELTLTPNPRGHRDPGATATAPGSPAYNGLVSLIREMVAKGERVIPGDPPYAETTVELVEIDEPAADMAIVTACRVLQRSPCRRQTASPSANPAS